MKTFAISLDLKKSSILPPPIPTSIHFISDGSITISYKRATKNSLFTKGTFSLTELELSYSCTLFIPFDKVFIVTTTHEGNGL